MYALALSIPIKVNRNVCNTAVLEFKDEANAFGFNYEAQPVFTQRIRLGIDVRKVKFPLKEKIYRQSNGVFRRANVIIDKTSEMHTDLMDAETLESLVIALKHSEVLINGVEYSMQGELDIDDSDFTNLANAKATLFIQGFNRSNISCK